MLPVDWETIFYCVKWEKIVTFASQPTDDFPPKAFQEGSFKIFIRYILE